MNRRQIACLSLLAGFLPLVAAAQEPATLAKQNRWVTSTVFLKEGTQLVTGGGESLLYRAGDVKIWDAKSGALVANLEGQPTIVWSIAASADGKTLTYTPKDAQGQPTGTVQVFDKQGTT